MPPFAFAGPGRIIFGRGEFSKAQSLVSELGQRPFVVHGATPRHAGPFLDTLGGAATRTVDEALELARQDVSERTALLDLRTITGDESLERALVAR